MISGPVLLSLTMRQVDGQVEIRVSDNRPGIPPDVRDRIFDKADGFRYGPGIESELLHRHAGA